MDTLTTIDIVDIDTMYRRLGVKVRRLRKSLGISQGELAYRSGLSQNHIGCLERGEKNVSVAVIFKVACGLGVKASKLFEGVD